MKSLCFQARDAADALGQITASLGPDAVVLSVDQIPAAGFSRLWRRPRLQVTAGLPEAGEEPGLAEPSTIPAVPLTPFSSAVPLADKTPTPTAAVPEHDLSAGRFADLIDARLQSAGILAPTPSQDALGSLESLLPERDRTQEIGWLTAEDARPSPSDAEPERLPSQIYRRAGVPRQMPAPEPSAPDFKAEPAPQKAQAGPGGARIWKLEQLERFSPRDNRTSETVPGDLDLASEAVDPAPAGLGGAWRSATLLHRMGLLPLQIERVLARARSEYGPKPPPTFAQEFTLVREALFSFWRPVDDPDPAQSPPIHVFLGPAGSGKSTVLCKWLVEAALAQTQRLRAWDFDSRGPNPGRLVELYGAMFGVPVGQDWNDVGSATDYDAGFIDLGGLDAQPSGEFQRLRDRLSRLPGLQIHLVLNAAYEVSALLNQVRAFGSWPVTDLIFTHLDEERRPSKLWNFLVGTNFTVRALSQGQNIPGGLLPTTPELLIS